MDQNNKSTSESARKEAFLQKIRALYKQEKFTECVQECDRAINRGWRNGDIYNTKAITLARLKQCDKAAEVILAAITLDPDNPKFSKNQKIIEKEVRNTKPPRTTHTPIPQAPAEKNMDAKSVQSIKDAVKNNKIYIDSCSLLVEEADTFWRLITPVLQHESKSIIIPKSVLVEVTMKFASVPTDNTSSDNPNLHSLAIDAAKRINQLRRDGLVEVFADDDANFADNVFLWLFTKERMNYNLLLITQDQKLAEDVNNLSRFKSVRAEKKVHVRRINKHGGLDKHFSANQEQTSRQNVTYVKCKLCGHDIDEERSEQGYCPKCLKEGEIYKCSQCGKDIIYTNYRKIILKKQKYDICKHCYDRNNLLFTHKTCPECNCVFDITYGEKYFFDKKGLPLPKKCKDCRS